MGMLTSAARSGDWQQSAAQYGSKMMCLRPLIQLIWFQMRKVFDGIYLNVWTFLNNLQHMNITQAHSDKITGSD